MATEILDSCGYALQKIKHLYIASRKTDANVITFPIEYTTISGSSDSIIRVTAWSNVNNTCTIGGQELDWREISIVNDNVVFDEDYQLTKQGKVYVKKLDITLPKVDYNTNAALKEFLFTADGEFAICKAIAFVVDENNQYWIIGADSPLILQDGMTLDVAADNQYKLSFTSISNSRVRNFEILP